MALAAHLPHDWFRHDVALADALSDKIGILLVVNVKERTSLMDDYEGDSIITEFLSASELDDLVDAFEKAGLYCETVLDEQGFLTWLDRDRTQFPRRNPIVYNLAQNGTGRARLATVAGLCRLNSLPVLDSDAYAVCVSQHKFHMSALLRQFGFPVVPSWSFTSHGWWPEAPPEGIRAIAKPTYESGSIGISENSVFIVNETASGKLAQLVKAYRQPLTIQEFIPGFEVEVPVFDGTTPEAPCAVGIQLQGKQYLGDKILTYQRVFDDSYGFYDFAEISPGPGSEVLNIAKRAFAAIGFNGIARVDFRVREDGTPLIMETASKPHITRHSSFEFAIRSLGHERSDLMKFLVGSAARRYGIQI